MDLQFKNNILYLYLRFKQNVNRRYSDSVEDISPDAIPLEKEGILSKLQLTENGRKIKPKWVIYYTTLSGSKLSFYKDIKNVEV